MADKMPTGKEIAEAVAKLFESKKKGAAEQVMTQPGKNQKSQLEKLDLEEDQAEVDQAKKAK